MVPVFILVPISISISISITVAVAVAFTVGFSLGLGAAVFLAGSVVGVDFAVTILDWHDWASGR